MLYTYSKLKMARRTTKCFYAFCVIGLIVFVTLISLQLTKKHVTAHKKEKDMKYILQWTLPYTEPFKFMGSGQQTFIAKNCSLKNCFVTPEKDFFTDIRDFDAIAFHGPEIVLSNLDSPELRSPKQKYIFASLESSRYYTLCKQKYENFFNWTWTYKLNSDLIYNYLIIRNKQGGIIGPKQTMQWMNIEDMQPTGDDIKNKLKTKNKTAAWMVSNCETPSKREEVVKALQNKLQFYGLSIDVFGNCGKFDCGKYMMQECWEMIEDEYYFYLSFENSFAEDYVTEKLLNPLQHFTVPVVFGGANYTRFMPDGIYLNARDQDLNSLAKEMRDIIKDKERYYNFFKWHNHYSYHNPDESPDSNNYCRLCARLNDEEAVEEITVYDEFRDWWNPPTNACNGA